MSQDPADDAPNGDTVDRHGDLHAVTGTRQFTADISRPGMLHAAFVRSMEPHARLTHIDTSAARALPGVVAVLTGADIGPRYFGRTLHDYPVLATDRVLFTGQRIAVVAAVDARTAHRGAELVEVGYESMPALFDLDDVMADDAITIHPDGASYEGALDPHPEGNLQGLDAHIDEGIDVAFDECETVHESVYRWDRIHAAPLETHACVVDAGDGRIDVWSTNKTPNVLRRQLARLVDRPEEEVVVHPVKIGGDFGVKATPYIEAACILLSLRTGRPVRSVMTYDEMLTSTAARHPGHLRLRTGMLASRLHAHEAEAVLDGGAFAAVKPNPKRTIGILGHALAHYDIPSRDERVLVAYSNNLPGGHVRSPGEFQALFAGESHVDELARAQHEDPIEFRLRHTDVPETRRILDELRSATSTWRDGQAPHAGIGISVFDCVAGAGKSVVACDATPEGVTFRVGVPDQGTGMYASFRRLIADTLAIPADTVSIQAVGADLALTDTGAGASRVSAIAGGACLDACEQLLSGLGAPPDDAAGTYWIKHRLESLDRPNFEALGQHQVTREQRASVRPSYGGLAVELHVDVDTGAIDLRQLLLVVETGRIIDPVGFRGQLEGGLIYGLGQTLFERLVVEQGQVVTATLGDYKIASIEDIPPLEIRYVHGPDGPDDQVRAVGELTNIGVAPAIANALDDAVGVRLRELPLTAERVWTALNERSARSTTG